MSILDSYIATNKSTAEIADLAGLTLADLRPLDTALPGDDVHLPEHVEAALTPVLGRRQTTIGKGKRTPPLIGKRGSGAAIQEGLISARIVQALAGGRRRTVPDLACLLYGADYRRLDAPAPAGSATMRDAVSRALRRLAGHGITTQIGGEAPRRWCLTPAGEEAGRLLENQDG